MASEADEQLGEQEQSVKNTDFLGAGPRIEFLDKSAYRQRRIRDAASFLPVLAVILMIFPLMWPRGVGEKSLTSYGMIYLFGLWFVLVGLTFLLSRVLRFPDVSADSEVNAEGTSE